MALPLAFIGPAGRSESHNGAESADSPLRVLDLEGYDESRLRPVPCRLYLPRREAQPASGCALVCFSHGMGGASSTYRYLGHHLAVHGVASLHLQPAAGLAPLAAPGLRLGLPDRQLQAARQSEAVALAMDTRFALDRIFGGPFGELLNPAGCVAAGHAWGALTPLLLAGAQPGLEGRALRLRDPRIQAAVLLSAPALDGGATMEEVLAPVRIPTLHITATRDTIRMPGRTVGLADRLAVYRHVGSPSKVLAVFEGGSSSTFTDRPMSGGPDQNRLIKEATQDLVTGFIAERTDAEPDSLWRWRRRHGEIVAQFERQG